MAPSEFEMFLTADEASQGLQKKGVEISPKTLVERARTKALPSHKVNGRRKFRLSELLAHYEEQVRIQKVSVAGAQ